MSHLFVFVFDFIYLSIWYFESAFKLNTRKYGPEKTPYFDTFHKANESKI